MTPLCGRGSGYILSAVGKVRCRPCAVDRVTLLSLAATTQSFVRMTTWAVTLTSLPVAAYRAPASPLGRYPGARQGAARVRSACRRATLRWQGAHGAHI